MTLSLGTDELSFPPKPALFGLFLSGLPVGSPPLFSAKSWHAAGVFPVRVRGSSSVQRFNVTWGRCDGRMPGWYSYVMRKKSPWMMGQFGPTGAAGELGNWGAGWDGWVGTWIWGRNTEDGAEGGGWARTSASDGSGRWRQKGRCMISFRIWRRTDIEALERAGVWRSLLASSGSFLPACLPRKG